MAESIELKRHRVINYPDSICHVSSSLLGMGETHSDILSSSCVKSLGSTFPNSLTEHSNNSVTPIITIDPVSSDEGNSDVDSLWGISEYEGEKSHSDFDDEAGILINCGKVESGSENGDIDFQDERTTWKTQEQNVKHSKYIVAEGKNDYLPTATNFVRLNSAPSSLEIKESDSDEDNCLKVDEKPKRRNSIADIFRW